MVCSIMIQNHTGNTSTLSRQVRIVELPTREQVKYKVKAFDKDGVTPVFPYTFLCSEYELSPFNHQDLARELAQ